MHILILHMRFHPDLTGTGPLVTHLTADLVAQGHRVTVVASMPHYGRRAIPPEYRGRLLHRSQFAGATIWRTFVYVPPNPSGFHRGINYLSYTGMAIVAGLLAPRPDVILSINPPITVGVAGWLLGLVRRAPLVFGVQDIWPECLVIIGQIRSPLLIRTFELLEHFIYRVAARIVVLSEGMRQNLLRKRVPARKIATIPNWTDPGVVWPVTRQNRFRTAHGLQGRFVVQFAGNIGYIAVLETVLAAAKLLEEVPAIQFVIVGEGNAKAGLLERARTLGLTNVQFLPTQPAALLPELLGSADIGLVTLNRRLGQLSVPSKVYSIMASSRPVLAAVPPDSEVARLVQVAQCGFWLPPENPLALARAIRVCAGQPALLARFGQNGYHYALAHFTRRQSTRRYGDLLAALGDPAGRMER